MGGEEPVFLCSYVVDEDGVHTVDSKINAVKHFPIPKTVETIRSFLGLAGYCRTFVKSFALPSLAFSRKTFLSLGIMPNTLNHALTNAPLLSFPDYTSPFTLCTDASSLSIGAVLMQSSEAQRPYVIAYASRVLNSAESKYSVTHLEALAVVWALKHFRDIIFGYSITVYTDHSAMTQLFSGKKLTGRLAKWYLTIQQFQPTIKYLPGKANTVADALPRNIPFAAVIQISNFSLSELRTAQRQNICGLVSCMHLSLATILPYLTPMCPFQLSPYRMTFFVAP